MYYTSKQIRKILERYQELRSSVEWRITHFTFEKSCRGNCQNTADTACLLVDIDNAMSSLTRRQYAIIAMIKQGFTPLEIQKKVNISRHTIKFHYDSAIFRILTYLNV
ncbi:MAG: Bacterial regulatory protein, luxR family [Firmicutes bacterium]|nr:Bacterial regulatory protein, luxR family [Bacillota bacterium]